MPHITIEYSANVADHHDVDALVETVHDAALSHGLPDLAGLRTRAAERAHYRVATGGRRFAFVAIHCRIGPGRDDEAKRSFVERVLDAAEAALGGTPLAIAWSIELTELDPRLRINRNHVRAAIEADALEDP
jgi:5-carboxymethyl-2-hydroxymuconate isomerase